MPLPIKTERGRPASSRPSVVVRPPKMMAIAINAAAMKADGSRPAMNKPPIDRFATKPRMIRLTQGGIVSAITAEDARSATASPGVLARLARGWDQDRANRRHVGHL